MECMKGNWSVRELRRQINSLYFERCGLSKNPDKLSVQISEKAETLKPADIVKSVYTFEFLGLSAKDVGEENDLETAILNNLQHFMLEMGHGFCWQKRILIGDEYNKNETLVEYATAGMDNQLFVSKYLVELPSREQLEKFMKKEFNQF